MIELATYSLELLRNDKELNLYRGRSEHDDSQILVLSPALEYPAPETLKRLEREYSLREELDPAWAARPVALARHWDRTVLVSEDPGGAPFESAFWSRGRVSVSACGREGGGLELTFYLRIAISLASAIGRLHQRGIIHKDIKPANVLVNPITGQCWLRGFGIASRLPRERQAPEPPEFVGGTLAYMAPEQTGRMNRSIDSRSDLYAFGVTLYEMLTGSLPFTASDPMEWVHCHIARRPMPPAERLKHVPAAVSAIIMKLLAKTAEQRYQTAAGLERDLRSCLVEWETRDRIEEFALGEHDTPDRLLIPEKLYGRACEIDRLLASFNRVVTSGTPELVLVSGYSGIGKSSVVNELHKVLVPPRGLFASGKFDQYKQDIPYATLAQALQSLVRQVLSKEDAELKRWRHAILGALGPNARLMVNLIPQLAIIIGEQPPVPELSPQDRQARFQLVFRRFLGVFAGPEQPLVLFLDDLQWLDMATLELLEHVVTEQDVRHLLLICAYRDNEVSLSHPLTRTLGVIRKAGGRVQEIVLGPLTPDDVDRLVVDTLHEDSGRVRLLAELVYAKTGGNPFFAIQFLTALADEGLLSFDPGAAAWTWDLLRIRAKGYTDDVADLMAGKLKQLPQATQEALKQLACLGHSAKISILRLVYEQSEESIQEELWDAVRVGLIFSVAGTYTFLHDRIQEAAYSLIPESARATLHLRIGRLLVSNAVPEEIGDEIFAVVNQLNRGAALIDSLQERERVAALNLDAGSRAKTSTAYASALTYLVAGSTLLAQDSWQQQYALAFALELERAECEFLIGDFVAAEQRLSLLSRRAQNLVDRAAVTRLQTELYTSLDRSDRAVEATFEYLRQVGINWSPHPTDNDVRQEYNRIWQQLENRPIEALVDLPLMTDPVCRATLDVLMAVEEPAHFTDENLRCLAVARIVNLSLEHGNSDGSCVAYVHLGWFVAPRFGHRQAAFRFGKLGLDLVEKRGLERFRARASQSFGYSVNPWSRHLRTSIELLQRSFTTAQEAADIKYAVYACDRLVTFLLAAGDPLGDVQREAERGLEFARKAKFGYVGDIIVGQLRLIRTLRGLTPSFSSFNDAEFDEGRFEQQLEANPHSVFALRWYWIRKLQARFHAGDYASAVAAAAKAEPLLSTSPGTLEPAEWRFYDALVRAALYDSASPGERAEYRRRLAAHHEQLVVWAQNCPENFENRAALVGAELARLEGRDFDAQRLYQQAIRSARANGFIQNEALVSEMAARFYEARGFEDFAQLYQRKARYGYLRWGADGKVRQIDELYPHLREEELVPGPTSTIGASVEHLDLATVIKVSQTVASEIVLEKLMDTLMRMAIEHAGAERGLLILPRGLEQRIEAEAMTTEDTISVRLGEGLIAEEEVPESIIQYVVRTQESVILDDAATHNPFSDDTYLSQRHARSILCLPLIHQAKLIGVLYLENNLAPHVFTARRIAVLKMLASQAAISLENTRLYRDLERREAKIRRLVDANIMGIFIGNFEGEVMEANEAFLHMVNYSREDLVSGCLNWKNLTPPEWRDQTERAVKQLKATGILQPYEEEYFRKDGSRVPVLVGSALFEEGKNDGVTFVLDLSEQKRAEEALRRSQAHLAEAQAELAHVTRVTALGELTASIAHEISQPLAAVVTNANASLRWLSGDSPDVAEAREAIRRISRDGRRAGDVISRMRSLFKKAGPAKDQLDLNEAIEEVVTLTECEARRNNVALRTELAADLPPIMGDRVQLQQVVVNLILNAIEAMATVEDRKRVLVIMTQLGEGDEIRVAVRDSGIGIDPLSAERIFDAFHTTKLGGLGMGLSISRSIVESHGGRLWAASNDGPGATFQFTLLRSQSVPG